MNTPSNIKRADELGVEEIGSASGIIKYYTPCIAF
jgi:hypothetical protein